MRLRKGLNREWEFRTGSVVSLGIATNIVACIMAVYIQKYELIINYLTNILFLIIIAITYIKMKINKWVALGFTLVVNVGLI